MKYLPADRAKPARDAGMRYMVITSKHHDGFALYPSEVSGWDIADSTPYVNDLIGPLAERLKLRPAIITNNRLLGKGGTI